MKEVILLSCEKSLPDVTTFLKRSGRYIDSGYKLDSFKVEDGLEAVFVTKQPNPIRFQCREEDKSD